MVIGNVNKINTIANGYNNINTGIEYVIIFDNPKFAIIHVNTLKKITNAL